MKRPLTGVVILFAAGIWVGSLTAWPIGWLLAVSVALLAGFWLCRNSRFGLPLLCATVFVSGILYLREARVYRSPAHLSNWFDGTEQTARVRGVIQTDTNGQRSFRVGLTAIQRGDTWERAEGRIYVWVRDGSPAARLRLEYGDELEFSAQLRTPDGPRNPGGFNLERWLAQQRVYAAATIGPSDSCAILSRGHGNPLKLVSLQLRARFQTAIHAGLEDEPKLAGVLAGLVIGERAEIPPETYLAFQRTGVFHVFSTSGLNVMLVTAVVLAALRLFQLPRRWCAFIALPLLVLYVFATGGRPGAVRSLVMASVLLVGWALVRPIDLMNSLAAAALAILAWDPLQLFDGGFILSFMVVAALVTLTPGIEEWFNSWLAVDPMLPEKLAPPWRRSIDKPLRKFVRLVSGSIAAWIGLLPLTAVYFNLFSPISIAANIIAVPALGLITAYGLVGVLVHPLIPWLTITLNNANFLLLTIMIRGVEWLGSVEHGYMFVQSPPFWLTLSYYALLGVLVTAWLTWWKRVVLVSAICLVAIPIMWLARPQPGVEISVLDLNRGRAMFVNLPGERDDFIVDAGDDRGGERIVKPFLRCQGVDRLARAIVTTGLRGQAGGFGVVAADIPVGEFVHNGFVTRSTYLKQWWGVLETQKIPVRTVRARADWETHGMARWRVLHPAADWEATRSEDNALVLQLETGPTRVLFLSEGGEKIEGELLARWSAEELRSQIVVDGSIGHGGSCGAEFIAAVQPVTVIKAARRFGGRSESADLGGRLAERGIQLIRTDDAGAVRIRLTAQGYSIQPWL